jgi:hypothetical protein
MAEPIGIEIVLRAKNEASAALRQLQQDFERSAQGVSKQSEGLTRATQLTSREFAQAARVSRLLVGQLAFELNPALGSAIAAMGSMGRATSGLALPLTLLIGGLAAGTAAFTQIIRKMGEMTAEQARLNLAVRQFDVSALEGGLAAINQRLEELRVSRDKGILRSVLEAMKEFGLGITDFLDRIFGASEQSIRRAEEKREKFVEATREIQAALAPVEAAKAAAEQAAGLLQLTQAFKQAALARGDLLHNEQLELQVFAQLQAKREAELHGLEARQQIERDRERDKTGGVSAVTLEAQAAERRILQIKQALELSTTSLAMEEQARAAEVRRLETLRDILLVQGEVVLGQETGQKLTLEDLANLNELIAKKKAQGDRETELLTRLQLQTAEITRQNELADLRARRDQAAIDISRIGADAQTRAQLDLLEIEARRAREIEKAQRLQDPERRRLALEAAEVSAVTARAQREFAEAARTDPFLGIRLGLRETADEFASLGDLLRQGTRDIGHAMARNLSDTFFTVVTGQFKKLADLPKQFGEAVIRTFTDIAARAAVGQALRGLLPGFQAFVPGIAPLAGGGTIPLSAAQAAQLQAAGIPVGVSSTGQFAVQASTLQAAQAGGVPLPSPSLFSGGGGLTVGSSLGAWAQGGLAGVSALGAGAAVISGGQLIHSGAELALIGAAAPGAAGAGAAFGSTLAGLGPALGVAGGALGLGFTVFTALQGPPTAANIATSAVSGALSGALIGTMIAPGVGTVVGAIAGGLLGGGAAAFGKGGRAKKPSAAARSAAQGQAGKQALLDAIHQAQTLEDLARIYNTRWSPFGEVQILTTGPDGRMWWAGDWDDPPSHVFVASDFLLPGVIDNTVVQVGQTGIVPRDEEATQALQDKARQIVDTLAGVLVAVGEPLEGGVTRTTIVPFTERGSVVAGLAPGGATVMVQESSLVGLSDDVKALLFQELARVAKDRDIVRVLLDETARVPVVVGTVTVPA